MKKTVNRIPFADFYMKKKVEVVKNLVLLGDHLIMLAKVVNQNPSVPELDKLLRMTDRMNKSIRKTLFERTISLS